MRILTPEARSCSAAPWTLMYYMVGGSSKKNQDVGEKWLTEHPKVLTLLVFLVSKYKYWRRI